MGLSFLYLTGASDSPCLQTVAVGLAVAAAAVVEIGAAVDTVARLMDL